MNISNYDNLVLLMQNNLFKEVVDIGLQMVDSGCKDPRVWNIVGAALGCLGRSGAARRAFLSAIKLDPSDQPSQVNYIASCFHSRSVKSGLSSIVEFFPGLDDDSKSMVLDAIETALSEGLIEVTDLPQSVLSFKFEKGEIKNS